MTGRRLEIAILTLALVGLLFAAAAGDPDIWTILCAVAAALIAGGLICAKWARIRAQGGRMKAAWLLTIAAAFLLLPGAILVVLILAEPTPVDHGGHNR